jgi:PAS domain S-box-containing protein/putative nucleotidyltransferase with HDIG domain
MKVLVVDDNEDSRIILRRSLEHDGYEVEEAPNGVEAIKYAKSGNPDMIISDILMPEMDGFKLCRRIKKDSALRNIPFIFYTSTYTDPENEKLAMSLGASGYIVKPIDPDKFLKIIDDTFNNFKQKKLTVHKKPVTGEPELTEMYDDSIVKKLDEKVKELDMYKQIFLNSNDAIIILNEEGHFLKQNSAHRALVGYSDTELQDNTPAIYLGEEVFSDIAKKLFTIGIYRGDIEILTKDGHPVCIELSAFSIADQKGKIICRVGIERDITKRKQTEKDIRRQTDNLKIINSIIRNISSSLELTEVLYKITKSAAELIEGDGASIAIYSEGTNLITYPYIYNVPDSLKKVISTKGKGLARQVIDTGEPVIVNDYPDHPKALKEFVKAGLKSLVAVPLVSKEKIFGALGVFGMNRQRLFSGKEADLLESVGKQAAIAIENASLYENIEQMLINTITSFASIIDAKSPWTKSHSERISDYGVAIGEKMGLDENALETLRLGGLLHDIGKIETYDVIIDKMDKLTYDEFAHIKKHPEKGAKFLEPIKQLKNVIPVIKHHHERFDGKGYPSGLKGDKIPLPARILSVADTYDSIISDRPYRKSSEQEDAIKEIKSCSGTQFDPTVVDALVDVIKSQNL